MSRSLKIYYGLSGSFKSTTIKSNLRQGDDVLWSGIKRWRGWEKNLIQNLNKPSDLNFALLHLSRLGDLEYSIVKDNTTLHIERGISDMLFYWLQSNTAENKETLIHNLIEEELKVSEKAAGDIKEPEKILLIQRDYDFVKDVVFKEETRGTCFSSLEDYIEKQERYIDFTKKYNNITSEIIITDAKDYLRSLGIKWQNS